MTIDQAMEIAIRHHQAGELQQAEALYRQVLAADANHAQAVHLLGLVAHAVGQNKPAAELLGRAVQLSPNTPQHRSNYGAVLAVLGRLDEATREFARAVELNPNEAEGHSNLGGLLAMRGEFDAAVASFRRAIALKPAFAEANNNLANAMRELGLASDAIAHYRTALKLKPDYASAHDSLLVTIQYVQDDARSIALEHQQWEQQQARPLMKRVVRHTNDRSPERRLRIGYVSGDFRMHPVSFFLEPLLAAHDPKQVEVFCYSDVSKTDDVTLRLKGFAHHWRDIYGVSHAKLCDIVRQDQIDVFIDLALHTGSNRLLAFVQKPAPVQVTYLGYASSSGLASIDWRLSDKILNAAESWGPEKPWPLEGGFCCYSPPAEMADVAEAPSSGERPLTFASFNALAKVTEPILELWAAILSGVPRSRLLIQAKGADQPSVRHRLTSFFKSRGVDPERLVLRPNEPMKQYVQRVLECDVCLDTYPFSGHTTMCHCLYLGVPEVSLYGSLPLSRVGLSLLSRLDLAELAVATPHEYVNKAVELANDADRRRTLRRTLPERMRGSPLMDARRLAGEVERGFRGMWREWCAST